MRLDDAFGAEAAATAAVVGMTFADATREAVRDWVEKMKAGPGFQDKLAAHRAALEAEHAQRLFAVAALEAPVSGLS
jgi:hypothetical protein